MFQFVKEPDWLPELNKKVETEGKMNIRRTYEHKSMEC